MKLVGLLQVLQWQWSKLKALKIGALILRWQYNESTFVARLNLLWAPDIHGGLHSIVHLNWNVQKRALIRHEEMNNFLWHDQPPLLLVKYTYLPKMHPWCHFRLIIISFLRSSTESLMSQSLLNPSNLLIQNNNKINVFNRAAHYGYGSHVLEWHGRNTWWLHWSCLTVTVEQHARVT